MFERFTDRARSVLVLANEEARLLGHNFIGTEHLLLALIQEGQGVATKALESLGISLEAVREKAVEALGPGGPTVSGSPPFTPRAKKVVEFSLREALQLGHAYIGTEHMLLGLVHESEGVDSEILQSLGADLSQVRERVIALLSGYSGESLSLASIDADLVKKTDVPVGASTLFGWDDAAALQMASLRLDARTERSEVEGVLYETCTYRTRPPPEISVSVAGASVTREAFDAYTRASLPDAEDIAGLGDAATYSQARGSLRVLFGSTMFVVRVSRHSTPKHAAVDAAQRVLANLGGSGP